jgi:tetratricopeptide (TPR) repeat protein
MIRTVTAALAGALALWLGACAPINQDRAQTDLAQGRLDDAVYDIQAALQHDPDNLQLKNLAAQIFTQRGVKYYQGGQMIAASNDFNAAVGYDPTYASAYDYLGLIAFQQHDWQGAINYGSKAAGLEGKPDPGYVQMARTQLARVRSGGLPPSPTRRRLPPPPASQVY